MATNGYLPPLEIPFGPLLLVIKEVVDIFNDSRCLDNLEHV